MCVNNSYKINDLKIKRSKSEMGKFIIVVGNFVIYFLVIDRTIDIKVEDVEDFSVIYRLWYLVT